MKTILATAYAVNPRKGSEDGTGWNLALQIARFNKAIVITRKNNREPIESWLRENPEQDSPNLEFRYFDLPKWARFWKKGSRGALLYFYLWQFCMPFFVRRSRLQFDIAHNLNFHNDWTPTFLGKLGKPVVWGPVGHHPPVPTEYILKGYGRKALWKNQLNGLAKKLFWNLDPFLRKGYNKARQVICINSAVRKCAPLDAEKTVLMPAVACEPVSESGIAPSTLFEVLTIGRFVPLKGFDVGLLAFAKFYHSLTPEEQSKTVYRIVGKGPEKDRLVELAHSLGIDQVVAFIEWMPREALDSIYRNAKVFLFPSHEGAGMVIPEALSHGIPAMVFDNEGPGELVSRSCALKFPYSDYSNSIQAFAKGLSRLFHDPELREEMSKAARIWHREKLTWDVKGPIFQSIYNSVSL